MTDHEQIYEVRLLDDKIVFLDPAHELLPVGQLEADGTFAFACMEDEDEDVAHARQDDWKRRIEERYGNLDDFLETSLELLHRTVGSPIGEWKAR